jgi:phosphoserine phosphatase RsbU/P
VSATAPTDRARLLIVDDLEVNRDLLSRRVARLGHEAGFADNGRTALQALRASPWDLVLLDITMPEMDGYETLARIKGDPALNHIPVIMVSAIDEIDSVVRCIELGADDYLTKPINAVILRARIESSLSRKRLADQKQATLDALAREMEIGRRIQTGFLPEALPAVPGWELAAHCEPARQVGGDFYDALQLADGRLAVAVADVCDKGVGAALYMALFRSLLRASLLRAAPGDESGPLLAQALAFINDYIAREHGRDSMFATMFVAVLEPASGRLDWINAGHEAPVLWRAAGGHERLLPSGPAVGLMEGVRHTAARASMAAGDLLLGFSDGVSEAMGPHGALGEGPILSMVPQQACTAAGLVARLREHIAAHVDDTPTHDDITLLALRAAAIESGALAAAPTAGTAPPHGTDRQPRQPGPPIPWPTMPGSAKT